MLRVLFLGGALIASGITASVVLAQTDTNCYVAPGLSPGAQFVAGNMTVRRNGRCNYVSGLMDLRLDTPPRNGRVEISGSGVTYTPNPNFSGSDSYVYSASARGGGGRSGSSASGRLSVTVSVTVQ
jgi:hypothetical protein